ncbi:GAF domain-containing sensor histidine kinase [Bordetella sp. LUAb4]|uniref:GAF domain-containing sensor histidine kinase n=1 Tax=Bordetella sp. LUAb4 TaxID=2843195 RepID=UPI001E3DBEAF|nr:GAF domain-containing sensor histidine kinase [Bordetella sp. LUAb4]
MAIDRLTGAPQALVDTTSAQYDVELIKRISAIPAILDVVCATTGMGFSAVARVTSDQWIACQVRDDIAFGLLPGGELELRSTICHEIRQHERAVVIDHVDEDCVYAHHHTPARYGFQSYISVPIRKGDGTFFGTLCAIDPQPRKLSEPHILKMFTLFAELIGRHIDAQEGLIESEAALALEKNTSLLREQFIAVLGHDLRNPLGAVLAGVAILRKRLVDSAALAVVNRMEKSVARMTSLIDDVLDFARGRLGGGISLAVRPDDQVGVYLQHVIDELATSHPTREVISRVEVDGLVRCDVGRLGQLLSNLTANALVHGAPDRAIHVVVENGDRLFTISVANEGPPIPRVVQASLFEPFVRGADRPTRQGLGLGLYIASEIALGHGGRLDVTSTESQTVFTFTMPNGSP